MRYAVDIDGTICFTRGNDYENATPIFDNIGKINKLYDEGHEIVYNTARGGTSGKDWYDFTWRKLIEWDCKFHDLRADKLSADVYIDDKSIRIEEL